MEVEIIIIWQLLHHQKRYFLSCIFEEEKSKIFFSENSRILQNFHFRTKKFPEFSKNFQEFARTEKFSEFSKNFPEFGKNFPRNFPRPKKF